MKSLRVTTFNIQHGRNHNLPGDVIDLPLMAKNASETGASVIGFNEVRRGTSEGIPGFPDTPAILGDIIGGEYVYGRAITLGEGKLYGNALVSKYPIIDSEVLIIPDPVERTGNKHYETRSVIKTVIDVEDSKVTVITSHFGLNLDERLNAAQLVLSLVKDCNTPVVFMGDLNTTPDDPVYAMLADEMTDIAAELHADDTTFPSDDPKIRIDYIFVKNAHPSECHSVRKVVSDHFALTAEIEFD